MAEINPESSSGSNNVMNISNGRSQSQIINLSFERNRSGNEETGENNRATSSQNVSCDSDYSQSQQINISFGDVSLTSDSDNELKSLVKKTVRDLSLGVKQTQLININFKSVIKMENKENQTEEIGTETNQNNENIEQQVASSEIAIDENHETNVRAAESKQQVSSSEIAIDENHEINVVHEVRLGQPAWPTSQIIFQNLENIDVEIGNVPNQELNNRKKGKLIGSFHNCVRNLVNLVQKSGFPKFFRRILQFIKKRKSQSNACKYELLKID